MALRDCRVCVAAMAFVCRLDVCWTFFVFLFLFAVLITISSITRSKVDGAMCETWQAVHDTHVRSISSQLSADFDSFVAVAIGYLTLHVNTQAHPGVEEVMGTLCSLMEAFDGADLFRIAAAGSFRLQALTACMHLRESTEVPARTWMGMASVNHTINDVYYLDNTTYRFEVPLRPVAGVLRAPLNVSDYFADQFQTNPLFNASVERFNHPSIPFNWDHMWSFWADSPDLLDFTFPSMLLYHNESVPNDKDASLFVQIVIDASRLLQLQNTSSVHPTSAVIFAPGTFDLKDPFILSNNWGQPIMDFPALSMLANDSDFHYLPASKISNPLMRAALKHVDLKALQQRGYRRSVNFIFHGAPATVTAFRFEKYGSPSLPIVCVSSQRAITAPFTRIMNIGSGVGNFILVVETALFFLFVRRYLSSPLQRVTVLLHSRVEAGTYTAETMPSTDDACFQLSEVRTLTLASRTAMAQLRQIDAFVPNVQLLQRHLQQMEDAAAPSDGVDPTNAASAPLCSSVNDLTEQTLTIVYLRVRATDSSSHPAAESVPPIPNHKPPSYDVIFPSPRSLEDFITVVHTLCRIHHGTVHRLTPEGGIVHFGTAVRTHLFSCAATAAAAAVAATTHSGAELAPVEQLNVACVRREAVRCARVDAQDAIAFSLELQRWLEHYHVPGVPNVRALVDTGLFCCGQYRPCGSDHTLSVAFGRDVSRDLGHVPASIGCRVMMTEETAGRVRATVQRNVCAAVNGGVRQLPVEALRTGRVGLNADVVVLYEALPGTVIGNAAWQLYSRCCFDAFGLMLRGDYGAALSAYRAVMDISDLDPGLMPRSLRREAAAARVTQGAVSGQVERLMKECAKRIAAGVTKGYYRERRVPLGIDAVLPGQRSEVPVVAPSRPNVCRRFNGSIATTTTTTLSTSSNNTAANSASRPYYNSIAASCRPAQEGLPHSPAAPQNGGNDSLVCGNIETGLPDSFMDSNGMRWYLPRQADVVLYAKKVTTNAPTDTLVLGSAGALCTRRRRFFAVDSPASTTAAETEDAPMDVFNDSPLHAAGGQQPRIDGQLQLRVRQIFGTYTQWHHPNLLVPVAYPFPVDATPGGIVGCLPGSSLRALYRRFPCVKPVTVVRLHICVLTALAHLHARGAVHGAVSLDSAIVDASGTCRLLMQTSTSPDGHAVFVSTRSCYVSPAMAAGRPTTPACDVFCYGLLCLEAVTRRSPWRWADVPAADATPPRTERALLTLMREGGSAFAAAVVDGRVVPALNLVDQPPLSTHYEQAARGALHRMLSYDPAVRPTAEELWELDRNVLRRQGVVLSDDAKLGL